tara:strand:- start:1576 stop:2286 length:711 start_codon:yes stop_codon:yes gene_type:complete
LSTLERCWGWNGEWACENEYPDHMVPRDEFYLERSRRRGLQAMCKLCSKSRERQNNPKRTRLVSIATKSVGGQKIFRALPKYRRREIMKKLWDANKDSEDFVISHKEKLPRIYKEINKNPPREKIIYPKEGYVYIFKNYDMDSIKIGKTDDVGKRLSAAQTWGRYKCLYYKMSEDCKLLEKNVHDVLFHRRVVEEGLGNEHFRVNLEYAKKVIDHEAARIQSEYDRESPRLVQASG